MSTYCTVIYTVCACQMNILIESETRLKYNHMRLDFVVYGNDTILTVLFRYFFFSTKTDIMYCAISLFTILSLYLSEIARQ